MRSLLVLACIVAVGCYEWDDSDFNAILLNDFQETAAYFQYVEYDGRRIKRQVNATKVDREFMDDGSNSTCPPKGARRTCCGEKDDLKMHGDALKPVRRMCFAEIRKARGMMTEEEAAIDVFDCDKVRQTKEDLVCIMECVGRKKNMTNAEGMIIADNARMFIRSEVAAEEWQKKMIDGIVDKCLKNMTMNATTTMKSTNVTKDDKPTLTDDMTKDMRCNQSMMKLSHCVWREFQLNCPQDKAKDNMFCKRQRERLTKNELPNFINPNKQMRRPRPQAEKTMQS